MMMLCHEHDEDAEKRPPSIGPEQRKAVILQMAARSFASLSLFPAGARDRHWCRRQLANGAVRRRAGWAKRAVPMRFGEEVRTMLRRCESELSSVDNYSGLIAGAAGGIAAG